MWEVRLDLVGCPLTGDFITFCWILEVFKWSLERSAFDSNLRPCTLLIFLFHMRDLSGEKLWVRDDG